MLNYILKPNNKMLTLTNVNLILSFETPIISYTNKSQYSQMVK